MCRTSPRTAALTCCKSGFDRAAARLCVQVVERMTGAAPRGWPQQKVVGEAQVLQVFEMQGRRADAKTAVAGCRIAEGQHPYRLHNQGPAGAAIWWSTVIPAVPLTSWAETQTQALALLLKESALLHLRHAFASPLAVGARRRYQGTTGFKPPAVLGKRRFMWSLFVHVDCHGLHDKYVGELAPAAG